MTADTVGGVWTYALELAQALGRRGVEVTLATMGGLPTADQRLAARGVPGLRVQTSRYKLEWMEDPWDDVAEAGKWLLGLAETVRPDVVHLNGYAHGALPWRCPTLVVGHSCVLSWWESVRGGPAPPSWDAYRVAVRRGIRAADLVVAPTVTMLASLEREYGPLRAGQVVLNGRSAGLFRPRPKDPVILAAGRLWDDAKNVATLAAVASRLTWPVAIAGEDRHPDGGRARYPNVRLLGRLAPSALADQLGRAAIYALPARYEPFGLSILEAALAGCALVLGDRPSLCELWSGAAVFVPPEDPDALEAALKTLITDESGRASLADRARRRALTLGPDRMAASYLAIYRRLIAQRAAPPTAAGRAATVTLTR
ncbi:MAG TPA: glycosyltransferase family 4 protein [Dehalococcoidia bacterium]|nr:glycosyltransferase family 4 protein [Dehalococcoidia bacterium]